MAATPTRLIAGSQLTTSAATYYTAPTGVTTIIRRLVVTNTDTSARTFTLHLIASGGSASNSNMIVKALNIAPSEAVVISEAEGQVLPTGGFIQALASAATAITITASGVEITA